MKRLVVEKGFAMTASDAEKLIKASVFDINLTDAYFIIADNYKFRESPITLQRLFEMAARGIAVIVGTNRLSREFEFLCEAHYE